MRNIRRRLQALERLLPPVQPPPRPVDKIGSLVIKQMSDEDLALTIQVVDDWHAGVSRARLRSESEALARWGSALETETRRMGYESFDDAERHGGREDTLVGLNSRSEPRARLPEGRRHAPEIYE